ncbi:MAG: SCO family protein [Betaproteobacteria bacterium]|nr:SCO family protein [Betaproteobacteria bacterium]
MKTLAAGFFALACATTAATTFAHKGHKSERGWERIEANEPAPAFTLTSHEGKRVALKDLRGAPVVITFLYTTCTDICPILLQVMLGAEQRLSESERRVARFIGITVDPKRDTPERLRAYIKQRGLDPARWILLTGSLAEATKVVSDYGVVVRPAPKGDFVHNSVFVIIDAMGRERAEFHGVATPPEAIAGELKKHINRRAK